ncbi:hypothetical protein AGMMS49975_14130 [Clostridia bacterium]|nr:hypothetical protein AGMMS49975_14130 [Clostridia bacterium]
MSEKFSDRLKKLRASDGLSQKALGEKVGLKPSAINDMEQGRVKTTLDRASCFADYFNVSLDYLVGRTDSPTNPKACNPVDFNEEELKIAARYRMLDGNGKVKIQERLDALLGK